MNFLQLIDWGALGKIVGIDIMLGGDNAVVIALACAALPGHLRNRAMIMGTLLAIVMRAGLLAVTDAMMEVPYLKLVAGAYLLFIGYKLLVDNEGEDAHVKQSENIWGAVWTIVMADLMMSVDNVLAVAAAAHTSEAHSTIYAIGGIILSIPLIVFGSKFLTAVMDKLPIIIWIGGGLLGWVGAEMMISDPLSANVLSTLNQLAHGQGHLAVKLTGFALVVAAAYLVTRSSRKEPVAAPVLDSQE